MKEPQTHSAATKGPSQTAESTEAEIPPGDSPPQPRWPLVLGASAWLLWLGFLVTMAILRVRTTSV
jgi:hypothetical protein